MFFCSPNLQGEWRFEHFLNVTYFNLPRENRVPTLTIAFNHYDRETLSTLLNFFLTSVIRKVSNFILMGREERLTT